MTTRGKRDDDEEKDASAAERLLRIAAVLAALAILGVVVIVDMVRDGTLEPTSIGLLTGVVGPVVTILLLKGSGK